jgi:hypothetical protein
MRDRIGFWFNEVDQHRHAMSKMVTLFLFATSGLAAREVPLLYGLIPVASRDPVGEPAGLSEVQIELPVSTHRAAAAALVVPLVWAFSPSGISDLAAAQSVLSQPD